MSEDNHKIVYSFAGLCGAVDEGFELGGVFFGTTNPWYPCGLTG
jgi:hypothetical protein